MKYLCALSALLLTARIGECTTIAATAASTASLEITGAGNPTTEESTTQSSATAEEGSGAAETTVSEARVTTKPASSGACASSPCENGGTCTEVTDGNGFKCECSGEWTGDTCTISGCIEMEQDLELKASIDCSNSSQNVSIKFSQTPVGQSAIANVSCNSNCPLGNTSVASVKCIIEADGSANFVGLTTVDCSKKFDELEPSEQIDTVATMTSDTTAIDQADVETAVKTLDAVAHAESITTQMLDSAITVTNNLLLATQPDAQSAVKESGAEILTSVDTAAEKVQLDSSGLYHQEQSSIALGIVEVNSASSRAATGDYYYGTNEKVDANFANSLFILGDSEPSQAYIKANVAVDERVWFEVFLTESEFSFFNVTNVVVSTVYSVSSESFELRFLMNNESENLGTITEEGDIKEEDGKNRITRYRCEKWKENVWTQVSGCRYDGGEGYAICTCENSGRGEYTMVKTVTFEKVDEGLSPGAIAGIVVGCVVGVALIIGLVYYFVVYRKNKNKVQKVQPVKTDEDIPMSGHDNARASPYD